MITLKEKELKSIDGGFFAILILTSLAIAGATALVQAMVAGANSLADFTKGRADAANKYQGTKKK